MSSIPEPFGLMDCSLLIRSVGKSAQSLRELRDHLEASVAMELPELSMGMTADAEPAVAEGATLVRVGTALFGPRPD